MLHRIVLIVIRLPLAARIVVSVTSLRGTTMATTHTPQIDLPRTPTATLVTRIKAEYMELPGLQLTPWQAQRLWGLDQIQCNAVLEVLVETSFLRKTKSGAYAIADR